ncbi:MAG TPA: helix-turn-helix transcriptional regulator [Puia sp.]|nr:helix-turn-helix transcriptional regulator [Puia sp.]
MLQKIGKRLREVRIEKGFSISGLADQADIDRSNLSRIENGAVDPSISTLYILADALDIPIAELLI